MIGKLPFNTSATLGVDLRDDGATVVACHWRRGAPEVTHAGGLALSSTVTADGQAVAEQLAAWLCDAGVPKSSKVVLSLPPTMVDYEVVEIEPGLSDAQLDQLAHDSMQQLLESDLDRASFDYWHSPATGSLAATLHLVWTSAEYAGAITDGLIRRGWQCSAIDAHAAALARMCSAADQPDRMRLLAAIGDKEVTMVASRGGVPTYVRNRIRFATESAAAHVANGFGISVTAAETLLTSPGISSADQEPLSKTITEYLDEWLENLSYEIRRTVQYLDSRGGLGSRSEILICGESTGIAGLAEALTQRTTKPVSTMPTGEYRWSAAQRYSPRFGHALALNSYGAKP